MSTEIVRFHQGPVNNQRMAGLERQWMSIKVLGVDSEPEKEALVKDLHHRAVGHEQVEFTVSELLDLSDKLGIEYEDGIRQRLQKMGEDSISLPSRVFLNLTVMQTQMLIARGAYTMLRLGVVSRNG